MAPSPPDTDAAVSVRGLRKRYGGHDAVDGIDFDVPHGEVFALLGPNGAGKTTTVEILEGFRTRDGGTVSVLGMDPVDGGTTLRQRIGIVLQETGIEPYLTVSEVLRMHAARYPFPRPVGEVIELVGLTDKAGARVRTLSGGQQRRLDLALGLVGDPELLFLDEPTTGFDPSARRASWGMVRDLCTLGKTVLLTTHYMDEAQALANTVAVIAAGRIVATGPPGTLAGRDRLATRITFAVDGDMPSNPMPVTAVAEGDHLLVEVAEAGDVTAVLHALTGWAIDSGVALVGLAVARPTLEDVYLQLTGDGHGAEGEDLAQRGRS
jgi:ABC-2 type transport system ATP-binding protein